MKAATQINKKIDERTLKRIKLSPNIEGNTGFCRFLSNGDFIFLKEEKVYFFSTGITRNNKWACKKILRLKGHHEGIESIEVYEDNIYVRDDDYIFFQNSKILKNIPLRYKCKLKRIISYETLTVILTDDNECVAYSDDSDDFNVPIFKFALNYKFNTNRFIIGNYKSNDNQTFDVLDLSTKQIHRNIDLLGYRKFNKLRKCNKFMKAKAFGIIDGNVQIINLTDVDDIIKENLGGNNELIEFDGNVFNNIKLLLHMNSNSGNSTKLLLEHLFEKFEFTVDNDPSQQFEWRCEENNDNLWRLCIYINGEKLAETDLNYNHYDIEAYLKENNVCLKNNQYILIYHYDDDEKKMEIIRSKWDIKFLDDAISMLKGEFLKDFEQCICSICSIVLNIEKVEYYLGKKWLHFIMNDDLLFPKYAQTILYQAIEENKTKLVNLIYSKCLQKYNEDPWKQLIMSFTILGMVKQS